MRGAGLMVLAMLLFAIEDALIKVLTATLPPGQIIAFIGATGALVLIAWMKATGHTIFHPDMRSPKALLRTVFEVLGTAFFVSSLALIPITTASAVIQATPIVVALGGAVFLGHAVGWRRWIAILVGFVGVLVILRPGTDAFQMETMLAVFGMLGLASRDLVTRSIGKGASSLHLSLLAFLALTPMGLTLNLITGRTLTMPGVDDWPLLVGTTVFGLLSYIVLVGATRAGNIGIISSFRYSRMIFAVIIGGIVFAERPDALTYLGTAIVMGAGIFIVIREARLAQASSNRQKPKV